MRKLQEKKAEGEYATKALFHAFSDLSSFFVFATLRFVHLTSNPRGIASWRPLLVCRAIASVFGRLSLCCTDSQCMLCPMSSRLLCAYSALQEHNFSLSVPLPDQNVVRYQTSANTPKV
jgi:hypothetical protein